MVNLLKNTKVCVPPKAFMLWGACLGYASLPKTFTNIIYQDSELYKPIDEYLETIRKGLLE